MLPGGKVITFLLGDLMKETTDAIVNPANEQLTNHGGISNQIVKYGGPAITQNCLEYLKKHRSLPTGQVFVGVAGNLRCKRVIHTVGPVYKKHSPAENERLLILSVENCIKVSEKSGLSTISMPFISSGIFGYPLTEVIRVMVSTISRVLPRMTRVNEVRLIHSDPESWSHVICPFVRNLNRAPPVPALPPTPPQAIAYYYDAPLFAQFISDHIPN